jgi:hypothetical protein
MVSMTGTVEPIYNKGVTVEREGRRRFAVISNGHRWGHFLLRRDAEQFAEDVRHGRALFSEPGQRLLQRKDAD